MRGQGNLLNTYYRKLTIFSTVPVGRIHEDKLGDTASDIKCRLNHMEEGVNLIDGQ